MTGLPVGLRAPKLRRAGEAWEKREGRKEGEAGSLSSSARVGGGVGVGCDEEHRKESGVYVCRLLTLRQCQLSLI